LTLTSIGLILINDARSESNLRHLFMALLVARGRWCFDNDRAVQAAA